MSHLPRTTILAITSLIVLFFNLSAEAIQEPQALRLAVDESHYGTQIKGTQRLSVQTILIRLQSQREKKTDCVLQCFFLKKGKAGEQPTVDDAVVFEVTNPNSTYEVAANPIKLASQGKSAKKKSSKKSPSKNAKPAKATASDYPREGFIVRLLCDGHLLRLYASNHPLERLAKEYPEFLDQAAAAKKTRHPAAADLLKK